MLERLFSTALQQYLINIFVAFWSPFLLSFVGIIEVLTTLWFTLICPMGLCELFWSILFVSQLPRRHFKGSSHAVFTGVHWISLVDTASIYLFTFPVFVNFATQGSCGTSLACPCPLLTGYTLYYLGQCGACYCGNLC